MRCAILFRLGNLESLAHDFRNDLASDDLGVVLGHRAEQGDEVHHLVRFLMQPIAGCLAGDRHHRDAIQRRVGYPRDKIRRPRSKCGQTYRGPLSQPALHVGHEGRALLVPREHKT